MIIMPPKLRTKFRLALLGFLLSSLVTPIAPVARAGTPQLPRNALQIPLVMQATDYSCGPAALLSVLYYWRAWEGMESSLYPLLDTTPKDGTEPNKMAEFANELGLSSYFKENQTIADLRAALARGDTVILDIQAWRDKKAPPTGGGPGWPGWKETWDDGHYVVLTAMDNEYAYVMDPSGGTSYVYLPIPELVDRWHDYEDRNGEIWRYYGLAIYIHGKGAPRPFPAPLIRME